MDECLAVFWFSNFKIWCKYIHGIKLTVLRLDKTGKNRMLENHYATTLWEMIFAPWTMWAAITYIAQFTADTLMSIWRNVSLFINYPKYSWVSNTYVLMHAYYFKHNFPTCTLLSRDCTFINFCIQFLKVCKISMILDINVMIFWLAGRILMSYV